ncbi:MAG: hypothetical protein V3U75_08865 [Methylococcaceae bacterium]
MKRLFTPLTMIATDSMKAILFTLTVISATYADTNSVDISTKYIVGDIVSTEGDLQIEVLENTEDRIEIGLFNQEDQMTAMLIWDVKTETGNVILNLDTEDEKTLPMLVTKQMNPGNRMETLADGLMLMAAQITEPFLPEFPENLDFEPVITKDSRIATRAITTSGSMVPTLSQPDLSSGAGFYLDRDSTVNGHIANTNTSNITRIFNITRKFNGRARYNLADGDQHPVWVRFLAYNNPLAKWDIMGGVLADKPNNRFSFTIPEPYDMDGVGGDFNFAALIDKRTPFIFTEWTYRKSYAADAWSLGSPPNRKRVIFTRAVLSVLVISYGGYPQW